MSFNLPLKKPFLCCALLLVCVLSQSIQAQEYKKLPAPKDTLQPHTEALRVYTESIHFSGREQLLQRLPTARTANHASVNTIPGMPDVPALSKLSRPFTQPQRTMQAASCKDSSYRKLTWADNSQFYLLTSTKTADSKILVGGSIWDKATPFQYFGLIVKYDSLGNVLWAKRLRGTVSFDMLIRQVRELSDGSLLISGEYGTSQNQYDTWVAKLTADGDLIWAKKFRTPTTSCNPSGFIQLKSMAEGNNGELLLAGTVVYCPTGVAFKLDASGNLLWSTTFKHMSNNSWADGIFFINNEVVIFGRSGSAYEWDLVTNVTFLRLNYQTGVLQGEKASRVEGAVSMTNFWSLFAGYEVKTARLNNGHFIMAGYIYDAGMTRPEGTNYFGVAEFDAGYNFVNGYQIASPVVDNIIDYDNISIDETGKLNFAIMHQLSNQRDDIYMGTILDGQFQKLRSITYNNIILPQSGEFVCFADGSIIYMQCQVRPGDSKHFWEFARMHTSDTSGNTTCMGIDTNFAKLVAYRYEPYTNTWKDILSNQLYEVSNDIVDEDVDFYSMDDCVQQSWCDTLKVHGPDTLCSGPQTILLSAFKNRECGSWVNWQLPDTSAISKVNFLNDTTVSLEIRSTWEGKIYASLDGRCNAQSDSIAIAVLISPDKIDLGKDTTLCPSNTIELNARKGFFSYRWQDGSTDSLFLVQAPGKYYVTASNACGIEYSDTVEVAAAPPIPFDLGADVNKCNKDSVTVTAPAGFLNYSWSPAYNVISTTQRKLTAFPAIDTKYYVVAEKSPGCFAYDSISIAVHTSSAIALGKDTSFCQGDSVVLNAGAGFQSYTWSTGASSQVISAKRAGSYIVNATDRNNCRSADTLQVLSIYPLPVSTLNKSPFLCIGDTRLLTPGDNFSSYEWQDGSIQPKLAVNAIGTYWVKITDANQCTRSDTVAITTILALPGAFLPLDTVLCNYSSMKIAPYGNFNRYTWSTGATTSSIIVDKSGIYSLKVTDQFGCVGADTIMLSPKECLKGVFIPSAFTPNGDYNNDVFKPAVLGLVTRYEFTIYNRWGQRIFSTQDIHKGWDGTLGGHPQDTGGYTWTCTWQLANEPVQSKRGIVTLIR